MLRIRESGGSLAFVTILNEMRLGWKHNVLFCLVMTLSLVTTAQPETYSFEAVDSLQQVEPRPVVIFIHTDWCRFCAAMKSNSFADDAVIRLLNNDFYFVDFEAESTAAILFDGRTFEYKPTGANTGVHELAETLGTVDSKLSYPVLCILNPDYEIIYQHNSFMNGDELRTVLEMLMPKD